MKKIIVLEGFDELRAAFDKRRGEGDTFPVLPNSAFVIVNSDGMGTVELEGASVNGTGYTFTMPLVEFLFACCAHAGIRTAPPEASLHTFDEDTP